MLGPSAGGEFIGHPQPTNCTVGINDLITLGGRMLRNSKPVPLLNVVSPLTVRTQLGRMLRQVEPERRSFVVARRGLPKAIS